MSEMTMQVLNYDLSNKNIFCVCVYILIHTWNSSPSVSLSLSTYNSDVASGTYCMSKLRQPPSTDDRHQRASEVVHELTMDTLSHREISQVVKIAHTVGEKERENRPLSQIRCHSIRQQRIDELSLTQAFFPNCVLISVFLPKRGKQKTNITVLSILLWFTHVIT